MLICVAEGRRGAEGAGGRVRRGQRGVHVADRAQGHADRRAGGEVPGPLAARGQAAEPVGFDRGTRVKSEDRNYVLVRKDLLLLVKNLREEVDVQSKKEEKQRSMSGLDEVVGTRVLLGRFFVVLFAALLCCCGLAWS